MLRRLRTLFNIASHTTIQRTIVIFGFEDSFARLDAQGEAAARGNFSFLTLPPSPQASETSYASPLPRAGCFFHFLGLPSAPSVVCDLPSASLLGPLPGYTIANFFAWHPCGPLLSRLKGRSFVWSVNTSCRSDHFCGGWRLALKACCGPVDRANLPPLSQLHSERSANIRFVHWCPFFSL